MLAEPWLELIGYPFPGLGGSTAFAIDGVEAENGVGAVVGGALRRQSATEG
jgi:hypothetical protein